MNNATEVLYISYDGLTDPLGQSQILPYLAGLSQFGFRFTIISCEKPNKFQANKEIIEAVCKKHAIEWHPISYTKKPPVVSTLYDISRIRKRAFQLAGRKNFRIVHCRSYISSIIGYELKRKKRIKYLFDMRGLWVNEQIDGGMWNLRNPLFRMIYTYFKKREIEFFNNADYVISLTKNGADEIHSWNNIINQPIPIEIIPCSVDMDLFNPNKITESDKTELKNQLGIQQGEKILSYIGSLGTWYMLNEMLDFYAELKKQTPNYKFLFITNNPGEEILKKAQERGIAIKDIIITQASRQQMPLYISLSDYTLFFIKPTYSKKASSPVKQGEAMSMGIPVICNSGIGDTDLIVKTSQAGVVVDTLTIEGYRSAIAQINQIYDSKSIIAGATTWYSLVGAIDKYRKVYQKLLLS